MRVESLSSRLEFNERRARALESAVVYKARSGRRAAAQQRPVRRGRREPRPSRDAAAGDRRSGRAAQAPARRGAAQPRRRQRRSRPAPRRTGPAQPAPAAPPRPPRRRRRRRTSWRAGPIAGRIGDAAQDDGHSDDRPRVRRTSAEPIDLGRAIDGPDAGADAGRRRRPADWPRRRAVKLAVVVQRYGPAINGGAELHARYIAEHLARHAEVEVLTTCATDYVTWRNELPPGVERSTACRCGASASSTSAIRCVFGQLSERVFEQRHSLADELDWLDAEGPTSPALVDYIAQARAATYDYCLFFSYRYYHAYHGARAAPSRAILVPTAERDAAIGLSIFQPMFRGVRALMYNSPEERAMIQAVAGNERRARRGRRRRLGRARRTRSPAASGRSTTSAGRSRSTSAASTRTRAARSCSSSSSGYLQRSRRASCRSCSIGNSLLPIPEHPRIRHLGFLDDADKFDAMAAAELLIMPSYFESLSMVALEAGRSAGRCSPTRKCDVLKGQCIRSNAGLYYETLRRVRRGAATRIEQNRWLARTLGRNGRQYLPRPLRLAGHRAEVPRHVRAARRREPAAARHGTAARLVRRRRARTCRRPQEVLAGAAGRAAGQAGGARDARPPGARDARLRRRDRPRGARHPARAARRRLRVGDLRRDRRSAARAADARLPRAGRRQPSRQPAAPPFLARIEGVADGLRAARSDGAHLPQHHAAGVFRRRAPHAGAAVLPRPARAAAPTSTAATSRSATRSSTARSSRRSASRAPAVLPVVPDFSHLDRRAELARRARSSTTTGRTSVCRPGDRRTRRSRI